MGKSLIKRFNGNVQQVLDDVRNFGIYRAMDKWGVRDYLAMSNWVKEETGVENYGINPNFSDCESFGSKNIFDQFVSKFVDYIARTRAENERLKNRINELEIRLAYYEAQDMLKIESNLVAAMEMMS